MHTCSICGKTEPWGRAWVWYGSYKRLDDGKPIVKMCSARCREKAKEQRLVPQEEVWLDE